MKKLILLILFISTIASAQESDTYYRLMINIETQDPITMDTVVLGKFILQGKGTYNDSQQDRWQSHALQPHYHH